MPLNVTQTSAEVFLQLSGEIDHHSARALLREVDRQVTERMPKSVVLDFSGVTFLDSSAIALVLRLRRQCGELRCRLRLERVPPQGRKVFAAAGLDKLVDIR